MTHLKVIIGLLFVDRKGQQSRQFGKSCSIVISV